MATPRQIKANQLNASKSTGPKTAEGKTAVSMNALKTGLRAKQIVLSNENLADYEALRDQLEKEFQPQSPLEQFLVDRLVETAWRIMRVARIETGLLSIQAEDHEPLAPVIKADADPQDEQQNAVLLAKAFKQYKGEPDNLARLWHHEALLDKKMQRAVNDILLAQERRRSQIQVPHIEVGELDDPSILEADVEDVDAEDVEGEEL